MIPVDKVTSITKAGAAAPTPTPAVSGSVPSVPAVAGTATYAATRSKVDRVTAPLAAVALLQKFIDENPKDPEIATAKSELEKWKKLADEGAEKIGGKWVSGEERDKILEKADKLTQEAWEMMRNSQTLPAIRKLEESLKVYPNSFRTNFAMGYLHVMGDKNVEGIRYLEAALKINPKSAEALNNLGVAYMRQRQYVDGITHLYKGAEYGDSGPLVQNLVNAIAQLPLAARTSPKVRPAMEAASMLAPKYGIGGPTNMLTIVGLPRQAQTGPKEEGRFGMSSGTGFFIADDGLILTNRHVVQGAKSMLVMMANKKQRSAEVVVIDDEQDLALIRLKPDEKAPKNPFVQLAAANNPGDGAECVVMGFPLIDRLGGQIKVTRGIVSSGKSNTAGADVVTDAKVNPGNSGGPMLDKSGNVIGVVTMKSSNSQFEDSYGLAISAGKVRKFLEKNNIKVTPGVASASSLSVEEVAAKVKPATVCIICTEREDLKEGSTR